ncbi:hypothetical protein D1007_30227 [Hordeum vulgare]|nr:hypothetical protein D1007_30227 [Hordeum vulgare]
MDFPDGGGATLSEMYQSARRLLLLACDGVARVKRLASTPASSFYSATAPPVDAPNPAGTEAVRREVAQIQGLCVQMDCLWRSIPAKGQRDLWKSFNLKLLSLYSVLHSSVLESPLCCHKISATLINDLARSMLAISLNGIQTICAKG